MATHSSLCWFPHRCMEISRLALLATSLLRQSLILSEPTASFIARPTARLFLPSVLQLIVGVPAILATFGAVLWTKGFGPEDRALFRKMPKEQKPAIEMFD